MTRAAVETVPVAVVIPTYGRGDKVLTTLEKVFACDPLPSEVWIHVDPPEGGLASLLASRHPNVHVLTSPNRLGPGGGRHQCLLACHSPYAVSFDDDSYPIDRDFFHRVVGLFETYPEAAVLGARIWYSGQVPEDRSDRFVRTRSYTGCGHAIRLSAYRRTRGYIVRPVAYGMEESDLALLLFSMNCGVFESADLRVCHDTDLAHHERPEIPAGMIANVALFAFLHYPVSMWGRACLQVANMVRFCVRKGRWRAIVPGVARIPSDCLDHRALRRPLPRRVIREFLDMGRTSRPQEP